MAGKRKLTGKTRKIAYQMLHDVCSILDEQDIPYVLEAGTLLGVIREKRLLPWDTDVDLTITADYADQLQKAIQQLENKGYRIKTRKYKQDLGPFNSGDARIVKVQTRRFYFFKGYSLLDVFIKYKTGDKYYWMIDDKNPVIKCCPARFYEDRISHEFDGRLFTVPADYEGYLEYHYGKNWRTPIKNWDFRLDDSCEKEVLKVAEQSATTFFDQSPKNLLS